MLVSFKEVRGALLKLNIGVLERSAKPFVRSRMYSKTYEVEIRQSY